MPGPGGRFQWFPLCPLTYSFLLSTRSIIAIDRRYLSRPLLPRFAHSSVPTLLQLVQPLNPLLSPRVLLSLSLILNESCPAYTLLPDSVSMSLGSLFARWMMRRNGNYNSQLDFRRFPFFAAILLADMRENSSQHLWLSIVPLGFGNSVVLQTIYIAPVANLPGEDMAVGTGFAQLVRSLGK
ncbi:hypothetical protein C8J56DRAFT_187283 [Mycena floridula]|nr:hypothetical protein C8J56DRAFT_187283 [Mycena floridula]